MMVSTQLLIALVVLSVVFVMAIVYRDRSKNANMQYPYTTSLGKRLSKENRIQELRIMFSSTGVDEIEFCNMLNSVRANKGNKLVVSPLALEAFTDDEIARAYRAYVLQSMYTYRGRDSD